MKPVVKTTKPKVENGLTETNKRLLQAPTGLGNAMQLLLAAHKVGQEGLIKHFNGIIDRNSLPRS